MDRGRSDTSNSFGGGSTSQRIQSSSYSQDASDQEEKVKKVSPTRRKVPREEKPERYLNLSKRDSISASDVPATINFRQLNSTAASRNTSDGSSRQYETITEPPSPDENISALLEVITPSGSRECNEFCKIKKSVLRFNYNWVLISGRRKRP